MSAPGPLNFNAALGIRLSAGGDGVELEARAGEHEIGQGMVHLAVLVTLGEVAAAHAAGVSVVPASLSAQFLKPARVGLLRAKGRVLSRGKRLCAAEGEVFSGDLLVAKVAVTFAVLS